MQSNQRHRSITMWLQFITVISLVAIIIGEQILPDNTSGLRRSVSEGVKSKGFRMIYGDADMDSINEVVKEVEKRQEKLTLNVNRALPPLPPQDVKCLMSVDKYCSTKMSEIKRILTQAVKDDCAACSTEEKTIAGNVMASMMAHDPVAWKYFLTRSALMLNTKEEPEEAVPSTVTDYAAISNIKEIDDNNIIRSMGSTYLMPGVNVKVQAYTPSIQEIAVE